jgi:signal transduction histidine kinase
VIESIRRRLTLGYVGILALILVLFGAIVVWSFSRGLTAEQDDRLAREAEAKAGYARDHGPGGPEEGKPKGPPPKEERGEKELGGPGGPKDGPPPRAGTEIDVFVVPPEGADVGDSEVYGRPPSRGPSPLSLGLPFTEAARAAEREGEARHETVEGSEGVVRLVSYPVTGWSGTTIAIVQTAESRRTIEATVRRLVFVLVSVGLGSLLLAGLGGLFVSGRAMRPVRDSFRRQRTFIADASHELKTPLALVKIDAEVMRRNPADPDNAGIVEDQLAEIDRMDALLSDLLTLARLDAGRLDVEAKPFDLAVVAVEAAGRFLKRAAAEGVRLEVDAPDELPASGDAGKTAQVLAALLDNAVRYTPEGGTVTVAARHRSGRAEATVTDTGPGISPEHLPRVFDRFYRAEEARTRKGGGTGLGLAIARDLARAQSGDLSAENTPDGACFTLTIPAAP